MELKDLTSAYTLANGIAIPVVGYGTFRTPATVARQAVKTAIEVGYRHIDTAAVYENEEAVGQGIKDSGIDRDSIFLTSELSIRRSPPLKPPSSACKRPTWTCI